jgi:hypothetical protein
MKKIIILVFILLSFANQGFATGLEHCPEHTFTTCYNTGQVRYTADYTSLMHLYKCSCGDEWWVKQ